MYWGTDENGKSIFRTVSANSMKALQKEAWKLQLLKDKGGQAPTSKTAKVPTLSEFLSEWLADKKNTIALKTAQGYSRIIRTYITERTDDNKNLPTISDIKINVLTTRHIQDLYNAMIEKGLTGETVAHLDRIISPALKHAVQLNKIPFNPCDALQLPKRIKKDKISIGLEGMAALKKAVQQVDGGQLPETILATGMRLEEARALKWNDIDFDNFNIRIDEGLVKINPDKDLDILKGYYHIGDTKNTFSKRTIEMPEGHELFDVFKTMKTQRAEQLLSLGLPVGDNDLIFSTIDGTCWGDTRVRNILKQAIKISGLEMANSYPDLRHTHATVSLLIGEDISQVSRRLGHADISTTLKFYNDIIRGGNRESMSKLQQALDNAMSKVEVIV